MVTDEVRVGLIATGQSGLGLDAGSFGASATLRKIVLKGAIGVAMEIGSSDVSNHNKAAVRIEGWRICRGQLNPF